jgi:hypothetical protein
MRDRLQAARLMATEFPEYSTAQGNASDTGKGDRKYRQDLRWSARCVEPAQGTTRNWRAVCAERCKHGSEGGGRKRASNGTSSAPYLTRKRAVWTSTISLFFHFTLVKYMELLGEVRAVLPVWSRACMKMPREPGKNAACLFCSQGKCEGRSPRNAGRHRHHHFALPNLPHVSTATTRFSALLLLFESHGAILLNRQRR